MEFVKTGIERNKKTAGALALLRLIVNGMSD
jgi:hypothetical protein